MNTGTLITVPAARRAEIVEIRAMISHPMETGLRRKEDGALAPKNVIESLTIRYGTQLLFDATLGTGIAAN